MYCVFIVAFHKMQYSCTLVVLKYCIEQCRFVLFFFLFRQVPAVRWSHAELSGVAGRWSTELAQPVPLPHCLHVGLQAVCCRAGLLLQAASARRLANARQVLRLCGPQLPRPQLRHLLDTPMESWRRQGLSRSLYLIQAEVGDNISNTFAAPVFETFDVCSQRD